MAIGERTARGHFTKGNGGRPKGIPNKNHAFLQTVKSLAPEALEKLKVSLEQGERWAVEFILNHALPKERTIELNGASADDIAESLMNGEISPSEARDIVFTMSKISEYSEFGSMKTIDAVVNVNDTIDEAENKYMRMLEK